MDWSTTGLCLDPLKMTSLPSTTVDFGSRGAVTASVAACTRLYASLAYGDAVTTETEFYAVVQVDAGPNLSFGNLLEIWDIVLIFFNHVFERRFGC